MGLRGRLGRRLKDGALVADGGDCVQQGIAEGELRRVSNIITPQCRGWIVYLTS